MPDDAILNQPVGSDLADPIKIVKKFTHHPQALVYDRALDHDSTVPGGKRLSTHRPQKDERSRLSATATTQASISARTSSETSTLE